MKPRKPHSFTIWLLVCAAAISVSGCRDAPGKPAPGSGTPRPEQVLDFAMLYGQNCAACHGATGRNGAAISLANPLYLAIAGVTNVQRVTASGVSGTSMPPFGKAAGGMLTDQQIAILAQGLVSTWGNPSALAGQTAPAYASSSQANAAQGDKDFGTFCARCHGVDGSGTKMGNGAVTGSLIDPAYLGLVSDQGLRSMILAGQTEQGPHDWRSYLIGAGARPMTDQEVTDVVAWLTSHRVATPGQVYREQQ